MAPDESACYSILRQPTVSAEGRGQAGPLLEAYRLLSQSPKSTRIGVRLSFCRYACSQHQGNAVVRVEVNRAAACGKSAQKPSRSQQEESAEGQSSSLGWR